MRTAISLAALAIALAAPLASLAQTTQQDDERRVPAAKGGAAPNTPAASEQYGQGGSPHCDSLSGAERDQCLKDEGAKTDSSAEPGTAAGGASTSATESSERFKGATEPERAPAK
jgi:hypothetical protein